jgi:hypothetical protein
MVMRDYEVRGNMANTGPEKKCGFHTAHEASSRADSLAQRAKCQLDCGSPSVTQGKSP